MNHPAPAFPDASVSDRIAVAELLGRMPRTAFTVIVRDPDGTPVVTRNAPLERDGTPMPTRYWLLPSSRAAQAIGRIESLGGVRSAELAVDPDELARAHSAYAADRDADVPASWDGPRATGGVGGTRRGTKCLHAHYAYFLAGGDDPVGRWVFSQLSAQERDAPVGGIDARSDAS